MDIFKRNQESAGAGGGGIAKGEEKRDDFEDLGRSARLKEIEKGFQDAADSINTGAEDGQAKNSSEILEFEKEWFSFLEE